MRFARINSRRPPFVAPAERRLVVGGQSPPAPRARVREAHTRSAGARSVPRRANRSEPRPSAVYVGPLQRTRFFRRALALVEEYRRAHNKSMISIPSSKTGQFFVTLLWPQQGVLPASAPLRGYSAPVHLVVLRCASGPKDDARPCASCKRTYSHTNSSTL